MLRKLGVLGAVIAAVVALAVVPVLAENDGVCAGLDSGKVDTTGDPLSVTVTAPAGFLIDEFCVKAGSAKQGDGPEYFVVDPPQASIVITHTSGKAVSHWSVGYVEVPTTTTTTVPETTTTTVPETTTTTVPETTTTTVPQTTTTTVPVTTTTVPDPCDESHPLWDAESETCELPFTK